MRTLQMDIFTSNLTSMEVPWGLFLFKIYTRVDPIRCPSTGNIAGEFTSRKRLRWRREPLEQGPHDEHSYA